MSFIFYLDPIAAGLNVLPTQASVIIVAFRGSESNHLFIISTAGLNMISYANGKQVDSFSSPETNFFQYANYVNKLIIRRKFERNKIILFDLHFSYP